MSQPMQEIHAQQWTNRETKEVALLLKGYWGDLRFEDAKSLRSFTWDVIGDSCDPIPSLFIELTSAAFERVDWEQLLERFKP